MAGQPKARAARQAAAQQDINPIDLMQKLSDKDLELLASAWLIRKGIDPASLTPSRAREAELPQFDLPWKAMFLAKLRETGNVRSAATAAGVSRQLVYTHRDQDDRFKEWWDLCLDDAVDLLEMTAWTLASRLEGSMIRFLLQAHRPEVYARQATITHRGDAAQPIEHQHHHAVEVYLPDNGRGDFNGSRATDDPSDKALTEQETLELGPASDMIEADWEPQDDDIDSQ